MTASTSYNSVVGGAETQAKLTIHQDAAKSGIEALRAKVAQQIYIIVKCKFLVNSKILNWTNRACFSEEHRLGNLGSKKLDTSESSFTK